MFKSKTLLASLALSSSLTFAQGIVLNEQNLRTVKLVKSARCDSNQHFDLANEW